ncbi:MAG: DUF4124 domain-containing protein [Lysobacter sp.]|nr:DUF4124 domain-containing protein [Lysobacter sp.]
MMRSPGSPLPFVLLFALAMAWLWPGAAQAQVIRCTTDSGAVVYTDKPCSAIGASERLPRGAAIQGTGVRRLGCARNVQDLIYEITSAIDQHDINRLGSVYHWVGIGDESGSRILDRLQVIVDRPLVDIVALRSAPREESYIPDTPVQAETNASAPVDMGTGASMGDAEAAPKPRRARGGGLVGLRLEQTLRNSATPSRTVFGLRRHFDCWWIVLSSP